MPSNSLDVFTLIVLLLLTVIMPLMGIWEFRRLKLWNLEERPDARTRAYKWVLLTSWGMTLGLLAGWFASGGDWASLGIVSAYHGWQWLAVGLALAAILYQVYEVATLLRSPGKLSDLLPKMGDLGVLAPRSPVEQRYFSLVAVTAGVCEEIVYRGILMTALASFLGLWPAVALSSVIFGMGHAYQGFGGFLKTSLVGLGMAVLTVFSGSLIAAMIVHAVIDLGSGRVMGAALNSDESAHS